MQVAQYFVFYLECMQDPGVLFIADITRGSLQLAWDFSTASEQCLTDRLLHMRDDAMKRIGDKGEYRVVRVQDNYSENIFR